ncbi:hypothetical protein ACOSQ4_005120 [Xanthoceras sorbifolium]
MKCFSESLVVAGQFISNDDLISSILGGLGPECDSVVVTITTKQGFISLQEVQFVIMSYESRLAQHNTTAMVDIAHASTNFAGANIYRGRGRGRNGGRGRLFCQLCGKNGHNVTTCYHRFDRNFAGVNN